MEAISVSVSVSVSESTPVSVLVSVPVLVSVLVSVLVLVSVSVHVLVFVSELSPDDESELLHEVNKNSIKSDKAIQISVINFLFESLILTSS